MFFQKKKKKKKIILNRIDIVKIINQSYNQSYNTIKFFDR